jgi:hypothetical protein
MKQPYEMTKREFENWYTDDNLMPFPFEKWASSVGFPYNSKTFPASYTGIRAWAKHQGYDVPCFDREPRVFTTEQIEEALQSAIEYARNTREGLVDPQHVYSRLPAKGVDITLPLMIAVYAAMKKSGLRRSLGCAGTPYIYRIDRSSEEAA